MAKRRAAKKTTKKRGVTFKPMSLAAARHVNVMFRGVKKRSVKSLSRAIRVAHSLPVCPTCLAKGRTMKEARYCAAQR